MKYLLILLGFVLHMLYLDTIVIYQATYLNNCPEIDTNNECLLYANNIPDKFYLKYFNVADLFSYKNIGSKKWRMQ